MIDLLATVLVGGLWVGLFVVCGVMLAGATSGAASYWLLRLSAPRDRRSERAKRLAAMDSFTVAYRGR